METIGTRIHTHDTVPKLSHTARLMLSWLSHTDRGDNRNSDTAPKFMKLSHTDQGNKQNLETAPIKLSRKDCAVETIHTLVTES